MSKPVKTASKTRIALTWLFSFTMIAVVITVALLVNRRHPPMEEAPPDAISSIVFFAFGLFGIFVSAIGYLVVYYSDCLTFNFTRPIWNNLKSRLYLVNIFVPLPFALGLGFMLSSFLAPVLRSFGMEASMAFMVPVLVVLGIVQFIQLWLLIWEPMQKKIIRKRLLAQNITEAQLETAILVGLSDPASKIFKRFCAIEEDVGALWIEPARLVYWGDREQWSLTRNQLQEIERRVDTRSTSVLSGMSHIVLHVPQPDGKVRQIRLHVEGLWTQGRKREMMDSLADALNHWYDTAVIPPPPPAPPVAPPVPAA